jgi:glycosyltransferase involved in cell wall biosynthesis
MVFVKSQIESLAAQHVESEVFRLTGRRAVKYATARWKIRAFLRRHPADLIHAHFSYCGAVAQRLGPPQVVSLMGSDIYGPQRFAAALGGLSGPLHLKLARWVASRSNATIVKSERMKVHLGLDATVIPNGVDLSLFSPADHQRAAELKQDLGLDSRHRHVLFAASPERPVKRYQLAAEAVRLANERSPVAIQLVAVSGQPQIQLLKHMQACDLLLLTSAHEGSPNVVKEAMACNLPIVSVDVGDVRQQLRNTSACCVTLDDHPHTIADAIRRILSARQPSNGRSMVAEFSLVLIARRIRDVYDRVLASPRQGSP